jgi:hypothetical protein
MGLENKPYTGQNPVAGLPAAFRFYIAATAAITIKFSMKRGYV